MRDSRRSVNDGKERGHCRLKGIVLVGGIKSVSAVKVEFHTCRVINQEFLLIAPANHITSEPHLFDFCCMR
jgi:hypothetical protein